MGVLRRYQPVHLRAMSRQPAGTRSRHGAAARPQRSHSEREPQPRPRHVLRPSQRLHVPDWPARHCPRSGHHRRPVERKLEHRVGRSFVALGARVVDGDGHSLQVAALRRVRPAGLGDQRSADRQVEERAVVPDRRPRRIRIGRCEPSERRRDARRRGDAAPVEEPRVEALRHRIGRSRTGAPRSRSRTTRPGTSAWTSSTGSRAA